MTESKISVIIPAVDEEAFLEKCINSVRMQKKKPCEIIVSINGSKDATLEIAKRMADTVVASTTALGAAEARNLGAAKAVGNILVFLDADCTISENMFEEIEKILSEGPALGTALAEPDRLHPAALVYIHFKNFLHSTRLHRGAFGMLFCTKEVFDKAGGFSKNLRIGELGEFINRARRAGIPSRVIESGWTTVSMRRLSTRGYLRTMFFWIRWGVAQSPHKKSEIAGEY